MVSTARISQMGHEDITIPLALAAQHPHQTWLACPRCDWVRAATTPTLGVLYRTQVCAACAERAGQR